MIYNFTEEQKNKIIDRWGEKLYKKILKYLEIYSEKWVLCDFEFVEYYSVSIIFFCKSKLYGDCVLKINDSEDVSVIDFMSGYNALLDYNNSEKFCKLFECDTDNQIMLIERIIPGKMLKDEPSLEKRLEVFSDLFNGLHIEPKNPEIYVSHIDWICDICDKTDYTGKYEELYLHALKAKELCFEISKTYNRRLLLHGDLHYDNILLDKNGQYKIIDPSGVIGDPVFDTGRYILNEYWDNKTVEKVIKYFEKSLNIPDKIIRQSFYIDTVLSNCWSVENDNAKLNDVKFAESVLNT